MWLMAGVLSRLPGGPPHRAGVPSPRGHGPVPVRGLLGTEPQGMFA